MTANQNKTQTFMHNKNEHLLSAEIAIDFKIKVLKKLYKKKSSGILMLLLVEMGPILYCVSQSNL